MVVLGWVNRRVEYSYSRLVVLYCYASWCYTVILSADWHLDDRSENEYRWQAFDEVIRLASVTKDVDFFLLGDLTDRKDRHSATLVNRLIVELNRLRSAGLIVHILMGNHDAPMNGPPYWSFLNQIHGDVFSFIEFITKPVTKGKLLLLPWTPNPAKDWDLITFDNYKAVFMHQTVGGALGDRGHVLEGTPLPIFPRGLKIYSGDVHTPQVIGRVTYVGAPHPVKFGDDYTCRMLILDDAYEIKHMEVLRPMKKWMLDITDVTQLANLEVNEGDQVRIRMALPVDAVDSWAERQEQIAEWAHAHGVVIASIEAAVTTSSAASVDAAMRFDADPREVLTAFAKAEGIDAAMLEAGWELLQEVTP